MPFSDEWLVPTVEPLISSEDMEALREIAESADSGTISLWEAMVNRKLVTDDTILETISARFRLPVADLDSLEIRARDAVPEQVARRHQVIPLRLTDSVLEAATTNPFDIDAEKMLAFATGREVRMFVASPSKIRDKLDELYKPESVVSKLLGGFGDTEVTQITEEDEELGATLDEASQRPIIRLVDMMLADGIASRASDIHVEPAEGGVVVRYRIDGVLRQVMTIPRTAGLPLISRIKIMSGLDIADRLRPQDGRARVSINNDKIDLRISTLPASLGEKVVIRILDTRSTILTLPSLGMFDDERQLVERLLENKEGVILVTGPTGSGKTTTLYSALRVIQGEGVNIVTVEDPVEYRLGKNIVQVQVNVKAGLTFATALRSILRQDPDVVLVGEIRDQETAQIAVQASLTGHLVLSTLHTNDAPTSVTRLIDMGMEPYMLGSALCGIIAQRLMRRLCQICRQPVTDLQSDPIHAKMVEFIPEVGTLYRAVGCPDCAMTGYRGRFCICEILPVTPEIERLVAAGSPAGVIAKTARKNGMLSLWDSGLRHVLAGETSVEELLRVTDPPMEDSASEPSITRSAAPAPPAPPSQVVSPPLVTAAPAPSGFEVSEAFELIDEEVDPAAAGDGTGAKGITVLLVDDEDQLRRVMKDLLEREGYTIAEAADGVEALDQADRHAPDVIVLDLNLPTLDGYSVLSQLRSRPATREVPIIVLTAKGDEDNEVRVFELGADDFLTKPFRARALSARLEAAVARRRV
ncbi:MAG TPA: type II/IV secretion system protein [Gemmatimonadales bacterium]|nr:type II/IV secretion system protein [Gemmatimonadales bacterium]